MDLPVRLDDAIGSIFSPRSSDRKSSLRRGCCDDEVDSLREVAGSDPSSMAVPFRLSLLVSLESSRLTTAVECRLVRFSHREKFILDVALDGMNRSDRPT